MSLQEKIKLVILGTSLFAPEVLDIISDTGQYTVSAFIENWDRRKVDSAIAGKPIIWIDDAIRFHSTHRTICSLGTTQRVDFINAIESMGFQFECIMHPSVRLSGTSEAGPGSLLSVGVIVASHTKIGRHVIINRGTLIGHDTTIHDFVTISPGANIAGAVTIGEGAYIGIGAIVLDRIKIGKGSLVGAGSVVTRDVPDHAQVMGVPAKIVKENISRH